MTKKQEIATTPKNVADNPLALIQQAVDKGASIEVLERMFTLQERWEKNQAKKAYDEAMTGFQAECPIIKRVKDGSRTKSGELAFKYAPLEIIIQQVQSLLRKYSLSYNFKTVKNSAGEVTDVRCYAMHKDGHSDFSEMPVAKGGGTSLMSAGQISAANITFAKRYAFCNIFGIVTENEDNEQTRSANENTKETIEKLEKCTQDNQVVELWKGFSKELRANPDVVAKTAEMRKLIRDAQNQEVKDSNQ